MKSRRQQLSEKGEALACPGREAPNQKLIRGGFRVDVERDANVASFFVAEVRYADLEPQRVVQRREAARHAQIAYCQIATLLLVDQDDVNTHIVAGVKAQLANLLE